MYEKERNEIIVLSELLQKIMNLELETKVLNCGYHYIDLKDNMGSFFSKLCQVDDADFIGDLLIEELEKAIKNVRSKVQREIKDAILKKLDDYVIKTGAYTPW